MEDNCILNRKFICENCYSKDDCDIAFSGVSCEIISLLENSLLSEMAILNVSKQSLIDKRWESLKNQFDIEDLCLIENAVSNFLSMYRFNFILLKVDKDRKIFNDYLSLLRKVEEKIKDWSMFDDEK